MHVKLPLPLRLIHGENNMKINLQILDSSLRYSDVPTYVSNDEVHHCRRDEQLPRGCRGLGGPTADVHHMLICFPVRNQMKDRQPVWFCRKFKGLHWREYPERAVRTSWGCDVTALSHAHSSIIKTHWFNLYNLRCRNNELWFLLGETDWNSFCLGSLSHQSRRECDNAFKQQMVRLENKEQNKYQPN